MNINVKLHLLTEGGVITLVTNNDKRSRISAHIVECMTEKKLLILKDVADKPNAVCKGEKIIGFYFEIITQNKIYEEYLRASTRYYQSMASGESWRNQEDGGN